MENEPFILAPELQQDCFFIADLALSQLLLYNNVDFPWLILVPRVNHVTEIFELTDELQDQLIEETSQVSRLLKQLYACDKINVAAIGNQVPQLHVHIIARFKTDSAWPSPVWGLPSRAYNNKAACEIIQKINAELSHYLPAIN
ncbi:MAG: hypothetical protein CMF49_07650 [Legionellales bacterium]|nr:hypothetical protein [Legionellales bacterium]